MRKIILASKSPRRRELLSQAGFEFDIMVSDKDEIITTTIPSKVVEELSLQKAMDVFNNNDENDVLVIGADTVVSIDGRILGKPADREESYNMISSLQGRNHEVYTGVTFVWKKNNEICKHTFYECTEVEFYPMNEDEINSYVDTRDGMDKAGSYGIQSLCGIYIKGIKGDYNNVVGLPIARLYQEMKKMLLCD